jgi:hypothetical protein
MDLVLVYTQMAQPEIWLFVAEVAEVAITLPPVRGVFRAAAAAAAEGRVPVPLLVALAVLAEL